MCSARRRAKRLDAGAKNKVGRTKRLHFTSLRAEPERQRSHKDERAIELEGVIGYRMTVWLAADAIPEECRELRF